MALTATFAADMSDFLSSLEKAQVKLQVFDKATKTSARDLTRSMESFSGQKIAAEASRMAEAVQRIGGANRLTEAEQRRVNATVTEAIAKYRAFGQEAPQSLQRLAAETKRVEVATGAVSAKILEMAASFTVANIASRVIDKAASSLTDFVRRGGDVAGMRNSFNALSGGVDAADRRIGIIRESTHGLVADLDAMAASNKATLLGLGLSDTQMGELAKTAAVLGRAMGQDATKSLDDFITALGRSSPMILDNLGLSVKVEEANERYAASLGKTADALSDAEKKQAFMTAAMDAAREKVRQIGDVQLNAADRANQLWIGLKNLADASASWVVQLGPVNTGLGKVVQSMQLWETLLRTGKVSEVLKQYSGAASQLGSEADKGGAKTVAAAAKVTSFVAVLAQANAEVAKFQATATAADKTELAAAMKVDEKAAESLALKLGMGKEAFKLYQASAQESAKGVSKAARESAAATEAFQRQLDTLNGTAAARGAEEVVKQLAALGGPMRVLPSQMEAMAKALRAGAQAAALMGKQKLAADYEMLARTLNPVVALQQRYNVTIGEYVPMGLKAEQVTERITDQMADLAGETIKIGPALAKFAKGITELPMAAIENRPDAAQAAAVRFSDVFKSELTSAMGDVSGILVDAITNGQDLRVAARAVATRIGSALGTALGMYFTAGSPVGGAVGGAVGGGIGAWVSGMFGPSDMEYTRELVRDRFGLAISDGLAQAIHDATERLGSYEGAMAQLLPALLGEAGGLNAANSSRFTAIFQETFDLYRDGFLRVEDYIRNLQQSWGTFADFHVDASGRINAAMREMLRNYQEIGIEVQSVTDWMRAQSASAVEGINAVINASKREFDSYTKIAGAVKAAQDQIDELNRVEARGRGADWQREMAKAQDELTKALTDQHKAAEAAAGELENLGYIAMGAYAAAVASGMSHNEAIKAASPGLKQLIKAYEDLGLSVEDAGLKAFLAQANFADKIPEVLAGIDGLTQSMIGLSNINLLTPEMFSRMQAAGMSMYDKLLAEAQKYGLEGDDATRAALVPMQEYLRQAAEQAELLGIPLDENTQKLIDQSKALGIWKDKSVDPAKKMFEALEKIVGILDELTARLVNLPPRVSTNVHTDYTSSGTPPGGGSGGGSGSSPNNIWNGGNQQPTPGPSPASLTGASSAGATIQTTVMLDGREIAMALAPHRASADRRWGV